ncbi:hypothetical protein MLD38_033094 [Melastoma candidum]|uniref:Uncharacterized protein n=1 Tax=Melastoma candidum TaxID=119954 RepID=A0ACB9M687_9MYRT|nr:hypothetical protein MLD38_033094 [Melastoma candidum]
MVSHLDLYSSYPNTSSLPPSLAKFIPSKMQEMKAAMILFLFFIGVARASVDEATVLLSVKAGLVDPLNSLKGWDRNSLSHCNWTGVSCGSDGYVVGLDFSRMNLSGSIADEIGRLQNLAEVNISNNAFSSFPGSILSVASLEVVDLSQNLIITEFPAGFGKLARLVMLNASSNNFSGFLPDDLGNASALQCLDLRGNFFEGPIPKSLKSLEKLKFLGLSGNNLTGEIPGELGQLVSLESMILGYNEFEGGIPAEFGNLSNLKYLDLAVGNLGGGIPPELGQLSQLHTLYLYSNNLDGTIPQEIGNLSALKFLDLSDNLLSAEIPGTIRNLGNLQLLNLMCNQLSGSIPSSLGGLMQLRVLELWNNSLSGSLPSNLGMSSPLQWLDISSNSFSGEIPAGLCTSGNLTKLILFNNAFTGSIPANLSRCPSLVRVRMQNNFLSGNIPVGLGKLARLQRLELANNSLTGQIPNDIASSTSLSFLDFSRNKLESSLPSTILSISNLQSFLASNNNFEGEIPDQFQDCPSLTSLDLSSNYLSGIIPPSIASCDKMVNLNFRNNELTGVIPKVLAMMPTLAILDLSNNSLSGGIPENFGSSPALEVLNFSYNKLEGPVPSNGLLRTISPEDLMGNVGLCDGVLPPCSGSSALTSKEKSLHAKHVLSLWITGITSILAIGMLFIGCHTIYKRWYQDGNCFEEKLELGNGEWPWQLMAFQSLFFTSSDITAAIKESNVIGMGATGTVYRAEILRSNTVVAVKKLWRSAIDIEAGNSSDDLAGEVKLLGRLRHRNIVRLLGFLHNDTEAMILYEYMPNGNLGEALHGKQAGTLLVDWVSRYNIAVGVAQGLSYLHHDCHPPVIHRDVKSNNILLDANLEARIADFGLARLMLRKNETVSVVAGSYGYIAPEYGYTLKVDEKIDIYSFGVVLIELVTGKRPLEQEFGESIDIVEWIRTKIRENRPLEEVLDRNIGNCSYVQVEMLMVLRIGLLCTAKLPRDRPSMRDVITMLGEAKPRRKNNGNIEANKDRPVFSMAPVNSLT